MISHDIDNMIYPLIKSPCFHCRQTDTTVSNLLVKGHYYGKRTALKVIKQSESVLKWRQTGGNAALCTFLLCTCAHLYVNMSLKDGKVILIGQSMRVAACSRWIDGSSQPMSNAFTNLHAFYIRTSKNRTWGSIVLNLN